MLFFSLIFYFYSKNSIIKNKKNICGDSAQNLVWFELTFVVFVSHLLPPLLAAPPPPPPV